MAHHGAAGSDDGLEAIMQMLLVVSVKCRIQISAADVVGHDGAGDCTETRLTKVLHRERCADRRYGGVTFHWEHSNINGPWGATRVLSGELLTVRYNFVMEYSDFEDAIYRVTNLRTVTAESVNLRLSITTDSADSVDWQPRSRLNAVPPDRYAPVPCSSAAIRPS
jgi:hypothetical protein